MNSMVALAERFSEFGAWSKMSGTGRRGDFNPPNSGYQLQPGTYSKTCVSNFSREQSTMAEFDVATFKLVCGRGCGLIQLASLRI